MAERKTEAVLKALMKQNPNLTREEKIDILKDAGYVPYIDGLGRLYTFQASIVAPEFDSWTYWD